MIDPCRLSVSRIVVIVKAAGAHDEEVAGLAPFARLEKAGWLMSGHVSCSGCGSDVML